MKTVCACLLLLVAPLAHAAEGEVCRSAPTNSLTKTVPLSNDVVFSCPTTGQVTVPQLYKKGWRVVLAIPQVSSMAADPLKPEVLSEWVLVVEKL
jgi:hypothetical protein